MFKDAAKPLQSFSNLTYENRLKKLQLPTLVYRRLRGEMIETYKFYLDCIAVI